MTTWNNFERKRILTGFEAWLGSDLFDADHADTYVTAFDAAITASRGSTASARQIIHQAHALPILWETFRAVADGYASRAAEPHRGSELAAKITVEIDGPEYEFPGAHAGAARPKFSLNLATEAQLEALPGIGPRTAARIVARREAAPFSDLVQLNEIEGLDREARDKASRYLTLESPKPPQALTHPSLSDPSIRFPQYVRATFELGVGPDADIQPDDSPKDWAQTLLGRLTKTLEAQPHWHRQRRIDVTDLRLEAKAQRVATELWNASPPSTSDGVALVRNGFYDDGLIALITAAQTRVWGQMFYFTSVEGSPGDTYLQALKRAKGRGVDVRMLLDADIESDYHAASRINQATLERLEQAQIPHRVDTFGSTTHAKILNGDDWVLCGSHNWTTRSLYHYDETSVLIESAEHAAKFAKRFEDLWRWYDPDPETRTIALHLLHYLLPRERRALSDAGIDSSRQLTELLTSDGQAHGYASQLSMSGARLVQLRQALTLMHALQLTEATAHALALAGFETPQEFADSDRDDMLRAVESIVPLSGRLAKQPVRLDVLEAIHE